MRSRTVAPDHGYVECGRRGGDRIPGQESSIKNHPVMSSKVNVEIDGPTRRTSLMFDKSAFQAVGDSLHPKIREAFHVVTARVLVHEIAGNLRQDRDFGSKTPAQKAASIARKFGTQGLDTHRDWKDLCRQDLLNGAVSPEHGPVIHNAVDAFGPNGETLELLIVRPDGTRVSPDRNFLESVAAENWGVLYASDKRSLSDEVGKMRGAISEVLIAVGHLKTPADVIAEVDRLLDDESLQLKLINWLIDTLDDRGLPAHTFRKRAKRRWLQSGGPVLEKFSRYAHYCARVQLLYLVGYDIWPRARELNDLADLEYLRLLPFVDAFAVDDRFVRALAVHLKRPGQSLLLSSELKATFAVGP